MAKVAICLFFLLIISSGYTTLQAQAFGCNSTLSIPAILAKRELPKDTFVRKEGQGIVCGVRDMRYMYLKTANPDIGITSFTVVIDSPDSSDIISIPNDGNLLNTRANILVEKAQKGSTIIFECIQARSSAGKTYILKPLVISR